MKNSQIKFYCLRQQGTDKYMPLQGGGRGYSFTEPMTLEEMLKEKRVPRLFSAKRNAHLASLAWHKGEYKHKVSYETQGWPDFTVEEDETLEITPIPARDSVTLIIEEVSFP